MPLLTYLLGWPTGGLVAINCLATSYQKQTAGGVVHFHRQKNAPVGSTDPTKTSRVQGMIPVSTRPPSSLPETKPASEWKPLKIGRNCPKRKPDRIPTIHFQGRTVSFREGKDHKEMKPSGKLTYPMLGKGKSSTQKWFLIFLMWSVSIMPSISPYFTPESPTSST